MTQVQGNLTVVHLKHLEYFVTVLPIHCHWQELFCSIQPLCLKRLQGLNSISCKVFYFFSKAAIWAFFALFFLSSNSIPTNFLHTSQANFFFHIQHLITWLWFNNYTVAVDCSSATNHGLTLGLCDNRKTDTSITINNNFDKQ